MKIHRLAAFLALALPVFATGCKSGDIIDPVVEIPEKRTIVVVPFRTTDAESGFDSDLGTNLAEKITKLLKEKAEFKVKNTEVVLELYNDPNVDPKSLTAKQVAELTKADYVLMGDVISWRHADENTYGLKRGSSSIDVTLYETADAARERITDEKEREDLPANRGRLALRKRRVSAAFPQEYGMAGIGSYDLNDEQIENGLLNASSLQIAWLLVPHTKDEEKLAAGK